MDMIDLVEMLSMYFQLNECQMPSRIIYLDTLPTTDSARKVSVTQTKIIYQYILPIVVEPQGFSITNLTVTKS